MGKQFGHLAKCIILALLISACTPKQVPIKTAYSGDYPNFTDQRNVARL